MRKITFAILPILIITLSACQSSAMTEAAEAVPERITEEVPVAEAEVAATPTQAPEPTAEPEPNFEPLPADAQRMTFQSDDGTELVGYYYPAAVTNAPVIVLMHWARGDQNDWLKNGMVDWLQNRGTTHGTNSPVRQSVIYSPMPKDVSFAIFTFDFRGFNESSGAFEPAGGLMDAKAAYEFAKTLEGVDPTRVAGIGSSIGADGVVDSCAEGCLGALSLSPGGYLGVVYPEAVTLLDDEEKPVTCVATEGDTPSAIACEATTGKYYEKFIYVGGEHGDQLFQNPPEGFGKMLYDWLVRVFEIKG